MKRFVVFSGDNYYPAGGWEDFDEAFEVKEEALLFAAGRVKKKSHDWAHVVDLETGELLTNSLAEVLK